VSSTGIGTTCTLRQRSAEPQSTVTRNTSFFYHNGPQLGPEFDVAIEPNADRCILGYRNLGYDRIASSLDRLRLVRSDLNPARDSFSDRSPRSTRIEIDLNLVRLAADQVSRPHRGDDLGVLVPRLGIVLDRPGRCASSRPTKLPVVARLDHSSVSSKNVGESVWSHVVMVASLRIAMAIASIQGLRTLELHRHSPVGLIRTIEGESIKRDS